MSFHDNMPTSANVDTLLGNENGRYEALTDEYRSIANLKVLVNDMERAVV